MIRPLTIATFLLACGSGLYLYQSKHEVQLLDRTIEKTVRDTGTLREQSRVLAAEWTMLNDPERLRQFSDTYLNLKAIDPKQFTSVADLDSRLPAPRVELPVASTDEAPAGVGTDADAQAAAGADPASATSAATVADDKDALPVPPIPATRAAQAVVPVGRSAETVASTIRPAETGSPASRPAEIKVAAARPVATADAKTADQRAFDQRSGDQHSVDQRATDQHPTDLRGSPRVAEARPDVRVAAAPPRPIILAAPRPQPIYAQANSQPTRYQPAPYQPTPYRAPVPVPAASPYGGSLLGMARGSTPPAPRPTPVNATYNSN
jgi:hypothetical protein